MIVFVSRMLKFNFEKYHVYIYIAQWSGKDSAS